ncbi:site-specific recombinase XerD [Actinocorallia herbida]|uniref:Site-specific recombinase XerD n=1 Tax=Actinocorallia herbida TaxID=58109 RepID=A0A3N1D5D5_9ACTN|nr:site-specific integrase [Actinocorallia herbida]ROO88752.1 site-specific recombinase XerD [Actinocorallia herbida]
MAQDPKINKLPNGKWRMRWNNGSKSFTADTRDEVVAFKAALLAGGMVDPRAVVAPVAGGRTFRKVANDYIVMKKKKGLAPGTIEGYERDLRLYVLPEIGGMDINEVRPPHIRAVLERAGKRRTPGSLRKMHSSVLYPIFKWAIGNEWRERANPCEITAQELSQETREQGALLPDDAPMFLDCGYAIAEPDDDGKVLDPDGLAGDFFTLLYGTGLRWQEAAALDVGSVDWKRRVVVVKQVIRLHVGVAKDKGKSRYAFRDIPLPAADDDPLVVMLRARTRGRFASEPLFVTGAGRRVYSSVARRLLRHTLELAKKLHGYAEQFGFHGFRRGFATAMEDREIPERSLKLLLGHARHTGATKAYVKLTAKQVENIRPYVGGMCWRASELALAA